MFTPLRSLTLTALFFLLLSFHSQASQADDVIINIVGQTPGPTALIVQLDLAVSDTTFFSTIQFGITPKAGSVTRPFSQTFSASYLRKRGYLLPDTGQIFLPVYGLYANYLNQVTLTYRFLDGSVKQSSTTITTGSFTDPCGIATPTVLTARTNDTDLSYDFMFVRGACGSGAGDSPVIVDTDGEVRWISPFATDSVLAGSSGYFDNAAYITNGSILYRVDLDGTITQVADYSSLGIPNFHHQIDPGRSGMILDADTDSYLESVNLEVDGTGTVVHTWNLADIISAAMSAGGDDPAQFVYPTPTDWFHNNCVAYRKSDDSLLVSSRENFIISLDYDTNEIKWILGDMTKKWFQFPSLQAFALELGPDTLPPIGQHALSFAHDDALLLMDNGRNSQFQTPMGVNRDYSSPRKYDLNLADGTATEVWNYPRDESVYSQFCGSVYEDAPFNYLIDYAFITMDGLPTTAQLLGLNASGKTVFNYEYPTGGCNTAYNSLPLHAEQLLLNSAGQTLNISTRGHVGTGEDVLIAGFIVSGFEAKDVVLRALGPSLSSVGISDSLANPTLTLYDAGGAIVAVNDDWENGPDAAEIMAQGLAPADGNDSALLANLAPGSYTAIVAGNSGATGVALLEAYDLSPNSNSNLGNISSRAFVGTDEDKVIAGFVIGSRNDETAILRGIGPSLSATGIAHPLANPFLTVYGANGDPVASNDNWQDDPAANTIQFEGLAPANPFEAATLLTLPPASYTAILEGSGGGTGTGLVEVYNLP